MDWGRSIGHTRTHTHTEESDGWVVPQCRCRSLLHAPLSLDPSIHPRQREGRYVGINGATLGPVQRAAERGRAAPRPRCVERGLDVDVERCAIVEPTGRDRVLPHDIYCLGYYHDEDYSIFCLVFVVTWSNAAAIVVVVVIGSDAAHDRARPRAQDRSISDRPRAVRSLVGLVSVPVVVAIVVHVIVIIDEQPDDTDVILDGPRVLAHILALVARSHPSPEPRRGRSLVLLLLIVPSASAAAVSSSLRR